MTYLELEKKMDSFKGLKESTIIKLLCIDNVIEGAKNPKCYKTECDKCFRREIKCANV